MEKYVLSLTDNTYLLKGASMCLHTTSDIDKAKKFATVEKAKSYMNKNHLGSWRIKEYGRGR